MTNSYWSNALTSPHANEVGGIPRVDFAEVELAAVVSSAMGVGAVVGSGCKKADEGWAMT